MSTVASTHTTTTRTVQCSPAQYYAFIRITDSTVRIRSRCNSVDSKTDREIVATVNNYPGPSFLELAFQNGSEHRNADGKYGDDPSKSGRNLVSFRPVNPEFTSRGECVRRVSISTRISFTPVRQGPGLLGGAGYTPGSAVHF